MRAGASITGIAMLFGLALWVTMGILWVHRVRSRASEPLTAV
jgi:hypothetical protein